MRAIIYLIVSILVVTFIRMVLVMIRNGFKDLTRSEQAATAPSSKSPPSPAGGHLVRDPVCGTYIPEPSPYQKTVGGQVLSFCSSDCRDRHRA
jgi:uncharacterized protein